MVAGLLQVVVHGFARLSCLRLLLARDSSRLLDDNNNTASETSVVGVFSQSVYRSFRVMRSTQTEGAGARQPPAQEHFGGRRCPAPNLRRSELA